MAEDYYTTLGVGRDASQDEIKKAYRRLAHEHHPDKGNGNDSEKFKKVNEAYQVLSNPEKRRQYDQFGAAFQNAGRGGAGAGFGGYGGQGAWDFSDFARNFGGFSGGAEYEDAFDIFSDIFGGGSRRSRRERGIDLEMELDLSFKEAVFGAEKEIVLEKKDACPKCEGSGAEPKTKVVTCPKCHGTGQIRTMRRTIFGQVSTVTTCDRCEGTGKTAEVPCTECKGTGAVRRVKKLNIKIPPGVDDGMRIRIANEGEVGYKGSNFGDLYLRINVVEDTMFVREGYDILSEITVSISQAALGAEVEAETIDGKVSLKIPSGTQSGKVLRLKGKGVPQGDMKKRGDHLLTVKVATPTRLNKKQKELLRQLAKERGEKINEESGFWGF
jgi:molecular chaperone DnaJ